MPYMDLYSLQPTVQNQSDCRIVYVMTSAYLTNLKPYVTTPIFDSRYELRPGYRKLIGCAHKLFEVYEYVRQYM